MFCRPLPHVLLSHWHHVEQKILLWQSHKLQVKLCFWSKVQLETDQANMANSLWYTIGFSNSTAATQRQMNFSRWFCIYFRYSPQFHNNSFSALGLQCLVSVMQKQFTLQSHHCKKGIEFYQTQRNWRSLSEIILSKKPKYFPNSPTTTCDWFSICLFVFQKPHLHDIDFPLTHPVQPAPKLLTSRWLTTCLCLLQDLYYFYPGALPMTKQCLLVITADSTYYGA